MSHSRGQRQESCCSKIGVHLGISPGTTQPSPEQSFPISHNRTSSRKYKPSSSSSLLYWAISRRYSPERVTANLGSDL